MNNFVLDFISIPFPHSGYEISRKLLEVFDRFEIRERFVCLTTDNASNNIKATSYLRSELKTDFKTLHQRCSCHILNLCVQNAMKLEKLIIENIRKLMSFIKDSPKRIQKIQEKCVGLATDCKPKVDVPTRWNSTLHMLEIAIKLKPVLNYITQNDPEFYGLSLSNEQWNVCEKMVEILAPFEEITVEMSSSSYPTLNLVLPNVVLLKQHLDEVKTENIKSFLSLMKKKLIEYELILENDMTFMSTILDPRFKLQVFKNHQKFREISETANNLYFTFSDTPNVSHDIGSSSFSAKKFKLFESSRVTRRI